MKYYSRIRKKELKIELKRVIPILKEKYKPGKIILFGSAAKGKPSRWSDLDIAIIKKTDQKFFDRILEVTRLVQPRRAIDFIVYTPDEIKAMRQNKNYFLNEIIKGKIIYEEGRKKY